jgi:Ethylbenzene dehydrogenase
MRAVSWGVAAMLLVGFGSEASAADALPGLASARVDRVPDVDGDGADPAWKSAKETKLVAKGVFPENAARSTEVTLRAVHTGTDVYLLVRWRDGTRDDAVHKPFVWDSAKAAYVEGPEREDMLSVAFEHTGPFTGDMLSPVESIWDVWHWKAARTNPQGFAMDRSHHYTRQQWQGKGRAHTARDGQPIWIARPEDAGDTVEKKQPAPPARADDRVPQYLPGVPSGSAGDVKAKGAWSDGWWTLELQRKLDTGHADDDTRFDTSKTFKMAVSVHDRTGEMDQASPVLQLSFGGK